MVDYWATKVRQAMFFSLISYSGPRLQQATSNLKNHLHWTTTTRTSMSSGIGCIVTNVTVHIYDDENMTKSCNKHIVVVNREGPVFFQSQIEIFSNFFQTKCIKLRKPKDHRTTMVRIRFHYPTKLGEGNVFTGVCQFVCRGWASLILCPFKGMDMPRPKGVGISRGIGYIWGAYV